MHFSNCHVNVLYLCVSLVSGYHSLQGKTYVFLSFVVSDDVEPPWDVRKGPWALASLQGAHLAVASLPSAFSRQLS